MPLQGYGHAVAKIDGVGGLELEVALSICANLGTERGPELFCCGWRLETQQNAEGTMQMDASAGVACPSSYVLARQVEATATSSPTRRQSPDPRCVSTYPHNAALIVSAARPKH